MAVRQIIANLPTRNPVAAAAFWDAVLGLKADVNCGFVIYLQPNDGAAQRTRVAVAAGVDESLPQVSFEVDDLDKTLDRAIAAGAKIIYGPATELWGMRRFFMRDPDDNLVSIVQL